MTSSAELSAPVDLGGRRLFITGGTGFVGRELLDYLAESVQVHGPHFEVVVLSREPARFLTAHPRYAGLSWLSFESGDVDRLSASSVADRGGYTDVVHAAAEARSQGDPVDWMRQIVQGTLQSLQFAVHTGAKRYLLASSGAVYGPQPTNLPLLPETYAGAPSPQVAGSAYGQAKRFAEQLCTAFMGRGGLETVVARYFALVGPHIPLDGALAIGNFIRDALQGEHVRVASHGRDMRSYLFGRDCAHWTFTLLVRGEAGEAYNVGSDLGISIGALARRVVDALSPGVPVHVQCDAQPGLVASTYLPDIAKAAALGLRVEVPLDEAIRRSAAQATALR